MYLLNRAYSFLIWYASSRVWHITSTETSPATGSTCWSVVRTNTAVFPRPDFAWQRTSVPSTDWGMQTCWTVVRTREVMLTACSFPSPRIPINNVTNKAKAIEDDVVASSRLLALLAPTRTPIITVASYLTTDMISIGMCPVGPNNDCHE